MGRGDFRNHAITNSFRKDSLTDLLNLAIQSPGNARVDAEFAAYQARYLNRFIPTLKIDALSASYVQTDKAGQPGDIRCALWNLPESIIENYWTVADFDVMAPVVYRNPGRIISHDEILSEADWRAHPFFTQHCQKYAIHSALMINLRLPGKELTHITLEYLAGEENKSFRILDKLQLELATLPFTYAWFYRFGAIDFPVLRRVFDLISDLTSTQLTFLRKFVSRIPAACRLPRPASWDCLLRPSSTVFISCATNCIPGSIIQMTSQRVFPCARSTTPTAS